MERKILFAQRLSALRKEAKISQKQLGEVIGVSNKAICTMEIGTRETTLEKLVMLAEFFHVSTDYLLGITDDRTWRGAEVPEGEPSPPQ
ncbi:MAG: helix-turn-helix transcriptional regulator [Oscillibacter sp.]|nr:helix-turn-helix transcriptional regulator [Oscillibacter sp.]